jgi:tetratricopeptide (TPR) repeat protein
MRCLVPIAALALLLFTGRTLADEVTVRLGEKEQVFKGTIRDDTDEGVTIESAGTATWSPKEVVRAKIKYECLQRHYETGRSYENSKEYDLAAGKYDEATKDAGVPKHARQYAWLRMGICYEKLNDLEKAVAAYKKLLEEMPKTPFKREVTDGQFNCYIKLGKWDEASKCLDLLKKMGDDGALLAGVYEAQLLERRAAEAKDVEFSKAAEAYKAVARKQPGPEVLSRAHAGTARCLLLDGQAGEAAEFARKALAVKGCTPAAAADAHQVIGESLLAGLPSAPKELEQEKNRDRALDAITEMMRAVLQYKGSPWAEQRAYYNVGVWAGRLHAAAVSPEWSKRASWAFAELKAKYPASPLLKSLSK